MSISKQDVNTYSHEGRIFQVEYAMKAMNLGSTTIGLKTKNFVILCSEKKTLSKLQNPLSIKKHYKLYDHLALGFSGIVGDAKKIVKKCRDFCLSNEHMYAENVKVEKLLKYLCSLSLKFSENDLSKKIFSRPFGASLLVAGYDTEPRLFFLDPSGSYLGYKAKAIGSGFEAAESILEEEYEEYTDLESSIKKLLETLKRVMPDTLTKENVEVTIVTKEGVNFLKPTEIASYL